MGINRRRMRIELDDIVPRKQLAVGLGVSDESSCWARLRTAKSLPTLLVTYFFNPGAPQVLLASHGASRTARRVGSRPNKQKSRQTGSQSGQQKNGFVHRHDNLPNRLDRPNFSTCLILAMVMIDVQIAF